MPFYAGLAPDVSHQEMSNIQHRVRMYNKNHSGMLLKQLGGRL